MRKEVFVCDECGAEKREVNHWFHILLEPRNISMFPWKSFNGVVPADKIERHVCGQACVIQAVQKWMGMAKPLVDIRSADEDSQIAGRIESPLIIKDWRKRTLYPNHHLDCGIHYGNACDCVPYPT